MKDVRKMTLKDEKKNDSKPKSAKDKVNKPAPKAKKGKGKNENLKSQ